MTCPLTFNTISMSSYFQTRKNSPTHIKRPMNAFMVFSHHERKKVISEDPRIENTQISKELGKRWKKLGEVEREPYIREADKLRQYHQREYPDYKYKPIKKAKTLIRTKYPSEENTSAVQRSRGLRVSVMRSNSGVFGSGLRSNNIKYGGPPLRQLDPNRPIDKITINKTFKSSLTSIYHKGSFLPLEPPSGQGRGPGSASLSPPAKVPYSPVYPTTPDPHSQPFYGECVRQDMGQWSPHPRMVPISPMTRSCPVTPLSRPHQGPHTPDPHPRVSQTKPPSPLFPKQEPFSWDLDSASLPDLTGFLDNFLPASSTELSLDVGDLILEPTPDAEKMTGAISGTGALPDNIDMSEMSDINNINTDLLDDNLIDLQLMEFVS